MIDVEMHVDVVVEFVPDPFIAGGIVVDVHVGEERLRPKLLAQEPGDPSIEAIFQFAAEQQQSLGLGASPVEDLAGERIDANAAVGGIPLGTGGEPALEGGAKQLRVVLHSAHGVHADRPLVHKRDERHRRLIGVATAGMGVHMREKIAGEGEEVGERRLPDVEEWLDGLIGRPPVPVQAELTVGERTGYVEIGRQVESTIDAGLDQPIQAPHSRCVELCAVRSRRESAVVMVNAQGVVADARQVGRELVAFVIGQRPTHVAADVDAVEPHAFARSPLELEVLSNTPQPTVLSRRLPSRPQMGPVQRGIRSDKRGEPDERDPLPARDEADWARADIQSARRRKRVGDFVSLAGAKTVPPNRGDAKDVAGAAPGAGIVHLEILGRIEPHRETFVSIGPQRDRPFRPMEAALQPSALDRKVHPFVSVEHDAAAGVVAGREREGGVEPHCLRLGHADKPVPHHHLPVPVGAIGGRALEDLTVIIQQGADAKRSLAVARNLIHDGEWRAAH